MSHANPWASKPSNRSVDLSFWNIKEPRFTPWFSRYPGGASVAGMRPLRHAGRGARRRLRPRLRCARRAVAGFLLRVPHRHGGRGRQTADADSLLMRPPRRCSPLVCVPVRALVRERLAGVRPHVTPCAVGRCAPCARRAMLGAGAFRRSLVCVALCGCPVLSPPHHRRGGGSPPASWPGLPVLRCLSPPRPGCRPSNHRANPTRVVTLLAAASPPPLTVRCAH